MNNAHTLTEDFVFAAESGEFGHQAAPLLRYVAAINPKASKAEFVAAAVAAGYPAHAAGARFGESRKFDRESYGAEFDAEGRAVRDY